MVIQIFQNIRRLLIPVTSSKEFEEAIESKFKYVFNKVINNVIFRTITWRILSSENRLMVKKRIPGFSSLQEECKEGAGNNYCLSTES